MPANERDTLSQSELKLLEAVSAFYRPFAEDALIFESAVPVPRLDVLAKNAPALREVICVSAVRLLRLYRNNEAEQAAEPPRETSAEDVHCDRCARRLNVSPWPDNPLDWPRVHRCHCGRLVVEYPPGTHCPLASNSDDDEIQRAMDSTSPEAWDALLNLVMSAKNSPDEEVDEKATDQ